MRKLTHNLTISIGTLTLTLKGTTLVEDVEPPAPKRDNKPTSPEALWVAALFRRSAQTAWTDKEIGAYVKHKALLTPEVRAKLEAYYARERAKGDAGNHRRDLGVFVNNLPGEIDRALAPHVNGSSRHPAPAAARIAGSANEGMSGQYAGLGRLAAEEPGKP